MKTVPQFMVTNRARHNSAPLEKYLPPEFVYEKHKVKLSTIVSVDGVLIW